MRRLVPYLVGILVVAAIVAGLLQATGRTDSQAATAPYDLEAGLQRLDGSPPPLAGLHDQAAQLLPGDEDAFEDRLQGLRGTPVVVNVWASWCGPCRHEFPFFQQVATDYGNRVAFLGVATQDGRAPAEEFLGEEPVPYPSYLDPKGEPMVGELDIPQGPVPLTVFLDRDGEQAFTKAGGYASEAELADDVQRYLKP